MSELLPTSRPTQHPAQPARLPATTFALADDDARAALLRRSSTTRETGIFQGPYLRVRLPFRPAAEGWRTRSTGTSGFPPYGHQAAAFARLSSVDLGAEQAAPAADAGHHRHRLGQDRGVPLPDPRPRAARQARGRHRDQGAHPLPDERARQRPGPPPRRAAHRRHPSSPGSPPALHRRERRRQRTKVSRGRADHRPRASSAPSAPDILLTNYKMLDQLLLRADDARHLAAERRTACSTSCSTSSTPTTAPRAPTSRCCCAASGWPSRATGRTTTPTLTEATGAPARQHHAGRHLGDARRQGRPGRDAGLRRDRLRRGRSTTTPSSPSPGSAIDEWVGDGPAT